MHDCIERMSRVIEKNSKIMVLEAAMNDAIYPLHLRYLGKPNDRCNLFERVIKACTPATMAMLPEGLRSNIFKSIPHRL